MTDAVVDPNAGQGAVPVAVPEPVSAVPVVSVDAVPAVVETAAPVADTAPESGAEVAVPEPTLLQKFDEDKKPAEKPAEAVKAEEKPVEAKPAEEIQPTEAPVVVAPVYTDFEIPEGFGPDTTKLSEFTNIIGKFNASQEGGQELLNMHAHAMREYAEHLSREQHRVFADTRAGWRKEALADTDIGGAGHQTAMGAIARMRDMFVPEAERQAFDNFLVVTGAGDHPQFLKLLHRAARYFDEPRIAPPNPKPPADNGKRPRGRGMSDIYDHPTSTANR